MHPFRPAVLPRHLISVHCFLFDRFRFSRHYLKGVASLNTRVVEKLSETQTRCTRSSIIIWDQNRASQQWLIGDKEGRSTRNNDLFPSRCSACGKSVVSKACSFEFFVILESFIHQCTHVSPREAKDSSAHCHAPCTNLPLCNHFSPWGVINKPP